MNVFRKDARGCRSEMIIDTGIAPEVLKGS